MDLLYFVLLVSVLIFVHELGHFACAKLFDVTVLTFSIGFGPKLVRVRVGETEYVLSALPIGGYVKLLGETDDRGLPPELAARSFSALPWPKRLLVALAGPVMNLALPLVVFFAVALREETLAAPVIGTVVQGQPAFGLLEPGDVVRSVDGEPVGSFEDFTAAVRARPGERVELAVERAGQPLSVTVVPERADLARPLGRTESVGRLGVLRQHPACVVGIPADSSASFASGIRTFDRVIAAKGRPIERFTDLQGIFDGRSLVPVSLLRPTRVEGALGGLVELHVYEPHVATVSPTSRRGGGALRVGIESADLYVSHVRVGSAGHRAGVLPGDRILTLDGAPVGQWIELSLRLAEAGGSVRRLGVRRGRDMLVLPLEVDEAVGLGHGERVDREILGIGHWVPLQVDPPVPMDRRIARAAVKAWTSTRELTELTLVSIARIATGELPLDTLGGPVTIFDEASTAARTGVVTYLRLLALVSVNLAVINLMPIPLLDGGQVAFVLAEAVRRRPLAQRTREYASIVGLVVLALLLLVALRNDAARRWPEIRDDLFSSHGD